VTQFTPTPEQQAIVACARDTQDNIIIRAYAGCAKTTTLELIARALPESTSGLFLAFNVKIKEELAKRMPENFTTMTLNGLGHRAWQAVVSSGRLVLDDRKIGALTSEACRRHGIVGKEAWAGLRELVGQAMNVGLVPAQFTYAKPVTPDTDEAWLALGDESCDPSWVPIARGILTESIGQGMAGRICYADQIYLPVCFGGSFPGFPLVMVDESQDLSPMNHIMLRKTARKRLIVVGDDKQAIYAWRGADSQSMENIKKLRDQWTELPLHTTFRCPKIAVDRARDHAPGFTAGPHNRAGTISHMPLDSGKTWSWHDVTRIANGGDVAIICRNNAPLLSMAFKLLRQRVSVKMLGRDIGKTLVTLARKLMPLPGIPVGECVRLINEWMERETALASANQDDARMDRTTDRGEALLAVVDSGCANAGELVSALEALFARDEGQVTLSTGHKAKGLEWDTVVHLDSWRIPSKWAKSDEAKTQEMNLRYVIETRMKEHLVLAPKDKFL
jgi:hypothetical protein